MNSNADHDEEIRPDDELDSFLRKVDASALRALSEDLDVEERLARLKSSATASESDLNEMLIRAGTRHPEDSAPTIEEIDLDLFRLSWEIEYGAASATPTVRGDADTSRSCRRVLRDDTFEELHGRRREDYDPAPRIDVAADEEAGTVSATVIVAGVVAPDVESVSVTVPTSEAGLVRIPLTIDRTDVRMAGTTRVGGPIGEIRFPLRLEVTRHGR
jgi:hypothetical protein